MTRFDSNLVILFFLPILPFWTQTFATLPANVCNRPRKRLQPRSQTFAVKTVFFRGVSMSLEVGSFHLNNGMDFILNWSLEFPWISKGNISRYNDRFGFVCLPVLLALPGCFIFHVLK